MVAMESSSQNKNNFLDLQRKKWVKDRPEERVRQFLLKKMIDELFFPKGLIVLEKSLHALPHLSQVEKKKIPNRRLDIVVFGKNIHPQFGLFPLLLIECKAVPLTQSSINQVVGYNDVVRAPFIALANEEKVITGHFQERGSFRFIEGLYSYKDLLATLTFSNF